MKRWILLSTFVAAIVCFAASQAEATGGKYLVILQAGKESHEGMARALHALLYSKELKEHGHEVKLVFDGAGTEWASEWMNPESTDKLKPMYDELKKAGVTQIICDYCSTAFKVKENLTKEKAVTTAEYQGHPSIAKWADDGYQIIIL